MFHRAWNSIPYIKVTAIAVTGKITIGMLVAFNMLAGQVSQPVLRLAQLWQDFQQARISVHRLGDILNTPRESHSGPSRAALPQIAGRIRFEGVTFRYAPDGPKILDGLDLDIEAGECVGIMGASGSGKSTVAKLIQRLYLPESGRVLIDGTDLAQIDPAWLRRQIGVVLQESLLFNRSIRDNIALADPGMAMDGVIEAAKLAGAHEFIWQNLVGRFAILDLLLLRGCIPLLRRWHQQGINNLPGHRDVAVFRLTQTNGVRPSLATCRRSLRESDRTPPDAR